MSTDYRRMQQRSGNYTSFDTNKGNLLPSEFASVTSDDPNTADGRALYFNFGDGTTDIKRVVMDDEDITIPTDSIDTANIVDGAVTNSKIDTGAVTTAKLADSSVTTAKLADGAVTTEKVYAGAITNAKLSTNAVATGNIQDNNVTYDKLSQDVQDILDGAENSLFLTNKGTLQAANTFNSGTYCNAYAVYQFKIDGTLAGEVGIDVTGGAVGCEMRYVNGYQVITQTNTQQIFSRKVNTVAPTFSADSWQEVINPAITALENTVGTLNDQLETALNGGGS